MSAAHRCGGGAFEPDAADFERGKHLVECSGGGGYPFPLNVYSGGFNCSCCRFGNFGSDTVAGDKSDRVRHCHYYKVGGVVIPDWATERREMVERQLRERGIHDPRVLA